MSSRFSQLRDMEGAGPTVERFRSDVTQGLRSAPKTIPCRYFYDLAGSKLFEQICDLDEYYPTRTELGIMECHGAEMASQLGESCLLLEYGSGSSVKTCYVLDHLKRAAGYVPIDISGEHLQNSTAALAQRYPRLKISPLCADFTMLARLPESIAGDARKVVYFPGSTLGNFEPEEAISLFRRTTDLCGAGGGLLLGVDRKKDPSIIHAAYNDARGVTAEFNRNLLVRINRELGANFSVERFWHYAFYEPVHGRVEMHLVSEGEQTVRIGDEVIRFEEGETIRTEYSYKYAQADLDALAAESGFRIVRTWSDEKQFFSVQYWTC